MPFDGIESQAGRSSTATVANYNQRVVALAPGATMVTRTLFGSGFSRVTFSLARVNLTNDEPLRVLGLDGITFQNFYRATLPPGEWLLVDTVEVAVGGVVFWVTNMGAGNAGLFNITTNLLA